MNNQFKKKYEEKTHLNYILINNSIVTLKLKKGTVINTHLHKGFFVFSSVFLKVFFHKVFLSVL